MRLSSWHFLSSSSVWTFRTPAEHRRLCTLRLWIEATGFEARGLANGKKALIASAEHEKETAMALDPERHDFVVSRCLQKDWRRNVFFRGNSIHYRKRKKEIPSDNFFFFFFFMDPIIVYKFWSWILKIYKVRSVNSSIYPIYSSNLYTKGQVVQRQSCHGQDNIWQSKLTS